MASRVITEAQKVVRKEQRRIYDATPEAKALKAAAARRHYEAHREKIKKQTKEYAAAHPEKTREYKRGYRDANREYLAAHRKSRKIERQQILNGIKVESGCIDCGYNADPIALDFDHRDGSQKRADVSQMISAPLNEMLTEVAKCDVRCANCHRIKTKERRDGR